MPKQLKGLTTATYDDFGRRYMPGGWWGDWADKSQQAVEEQSDLIMGQKPPLNVVNNFRGPIKSAYPGAEPPYKSIGTLVNDPISLIKKYFPPSEWQTAYAVMMSESSGNPSIPSHFNQSGGEDSHGLFQINLHAHADRIPGNTWGEKVAWLRVPENNIAFARQLYDESGWQPWGGYTSGGYTKYLAEANQTMNVSQQGDFGNTINKFMAALTPSVSATEGDYTPAFMSSKPSSEFMTKYPEYTVQKGDTLWDIASNFLGSGARWKELQGYTGEPTKMPVGTRIGIPAPMSIAPAAKTVAKTTPQPSTYRAPTPQQQIAQYFQPNTLGGFPTASASAPPPKPSPVSNYFAPGTIGGFKVSSPPPPAKVPMPTTTFIQKSINAISKFFQPNTIGGFRY